MTHQSPLDNMFQETFEALDKLVSELPSYKLEPCKSCDNKAHCVGKCDKTIQ